MSLSFPLYDTIVSNIESESLEHKPADLNKLLKNLGNLDQDGKNKVYALIRYYHQKHEEASPTILPYEGQLVGEDLIFDLNKFPSLLQIILSEFCKIHIKHMKYNQKIEKIRKKSG